LIGQRLAHYRITSAIGKGGMGQVYRATDTKLHRDVALKVLPPEMAASRELIERFQREARAVAALNHPNVVTIHSVEEAEGIHFLTMELIDGQSLDRRIGAAGMRPSEVIDIATSVAQALSAAHAKGIVHRDLKPANVMLTNDGRVKVLDFGLAKMNRVADERIDGDAVTDGDEATDVQTREGVVMGTMPYMSPEQLQGQPLDHRTDLFSLGVMLYEMASGERPFRGVSSPDLASAILRDTPRPLVERRNDLPEALTRVIARCLEKRAANRLQSANEVLRELSGSAAKVERLTAPDALTTPLPREPSGSAAGESTGGTAARKWMAALAILVVLAISSWFLLRSRAAQPAAAGAQQTAIPNVIRSIAVLPLDNYSGDAKQDYFVEGMTDELTASLATISQLRVISRSSTMQFTGAHRPPTPEIAKLLNVDAVVEGSVKRSGDRVRITAQLIDARADRHLWSQSFERSSGDVFAMQADLASAIAHAVDVQLTPNERTRMAASPKVNPEAHDAYLKGRYFFNRPSDENLKKAIAQFEEAVRLSPDFAPAWSGVSDAYLWAGYNEGFLTASEARPKAKAAAETAVRLDPNSAEAHTSLAVFNVFYEYDWETCEREFRRAIALNPSYAFAHDQFGLALAFQGRLDESIAEGKLAAALDPLSPQIPIDGSMAYMFRGDTAMAKSLAAKAAELDPAYYFGTMVHGWAECEAGNPSAAIPALTKAKAMGSPAFVVAWLGYAYGASGDRARAMNELETLKKSSLRGEVAPFNLALVHLGLGDRKRTLDYLEQAYATDSQWLGWLRNDHIFEPIRSEPRFQALLRKVRLGG
jgi:serine/threonine protein kinase/tetratricopeptide (TPR) repeat protein